jgi:hypothetical protein
MNKCKGDVYFLKSIAATPRWAWVFDPVQFLTVGLEFPN